MQWQLGYVSIEDVKVTINSKFYTKGVKLYNDNKIWVKTKPFL